MESQSILSLEAASRLKMPSNDSSNALAGALGSIIGYLGAEVAEPAIFERLLWPQRFYNRNTFVGAARAALMNPMGGPVHKAALQVLDAFRAKGLYGGMQQGHMLGTAFYEDTRLEYTLHGYDGTDRDTKVRNGLWANVLRRLRKYQPLPRITVDKHSDTEKSGGEFKIVRRTSQFVQHLKMSPAGKQTDNVVVFCEDSVPISAYGIILASEVTAIACAIAIMLSEHCYWFGAYMLIPLVLRILAIPLSVRREPASSTRDSGPPSEDMVLVEISDYDHGFPLISGPESIVRQFFRHWGHPVRHNGRDRFREIANITLVVAFVLYFPAGLLTMLWVDSPVQVIWLGYQVYTIVVMHINRLGGFGGPGRMDDAIARELANGKTVRLTSNGATAVDAKLESHPVGRIKEGKDRVQRIAEDHSKMHGKPKKLIRVDSDMSDATMLNDRKSSF